MVRLWDAMRLGWNMSRIQHVISLLYQTSPPFDKQYILAAYPDLSKLLINCSIPTDLQRYSSQGLSNSPTSRVVYNSKSTGDLEARKLLFLLAK